MKFDTLAQILAHEFVGNHHSDSEAFNAIEDFAADANNGEAERVQALLTMGRKGMGLTPEENHEHLPNKQILKEFMEERDAPVIPTYFDNAPEEVGVQLIFSRPLKKEEARIIVAHASAEYVADNPAFINCDETDKASIIQFLRSRGFVEHKPPNAELGTRFRRQHVRSYKIQINEYQRNLLEAVMDAVLKNTTLAAGLALQKGEWEDNALLELQCLYTMTHELPTHNDPANTLHGFCL